MARKFININVTNTQPFLVNVSLFGGLQDPNRFSVNANTLYTWDTGAVNFSINPTFTIQVKKATDPTFITLSGNMYNSFSGLIDGLNNLNIGMFWYEILGSLSIVYASSDYYVFGNIDFPN